MSIVSAAEKAYKPAFVFAGKNPQYRHENTNLQSLHTYPLSWYVYQQEQSMESDFFLDWAKEGLLETNDLRSSGNYVLLIYGVYKSDVQIVVRNSKSASELLLLAYLLINPMYWNL